MRREPDSIGWIDDRHVATANEFDWVGGTPDWTVFDASSGAVVWDAGNSLEQQVIANGSWNEDRIGRYDVAAGTWSFYGYQLEKTNTPGDWMGLSEITHVGTRKGRDVLAVIERDKLNGPDARVKRLYTVTVAGPGAADGETLPVLDKALAFDVLPVLRSTNGWTQEKLEGMTIDARGDVYVITDNDGAKDATGETVFANLGRVLGR